MFSGYSWKKKPVMVWKMVQKELYFQEKPDVQLDDLVGIERTVSEKNEEFSKLLIHQLAYARTTF